MNHKFKRWFLTLASCAILGCSHTSAPSCKLSQEMPPLPAPEASNTLSSGSEAAPSIQVPEMAYDFGQIKEDGDFVHEFKIKNAGSTLLKIKKVIPA